MINIKSLISHRFRGFAPHENTLAGLSAALDYGVQLLEFDIRVARCGTPMIYHDEHAHAGDGTEHQLCDVMADDFAAIGGVFARMPRAEDLFALIGAHPNHTARFLIDIKDAGFESEIYALIRLNQLQGRVVYVSWLPEVLFNMHDIDPAADFCLSHWCQSPDVQTRAAHKVFRAKDGRVERPARRYAHGERSGWFLDAPLAGRLRDIVTSVCVPQNMVSRELVDNYHRDNIRLSCFSYVDWAHIHRDKAQYDIDDFFIDNKRVFTEL